MSRSALAAHANTGCLAAGTRDNKPVYRRSTLEALKPKPFVPHKKDPERDEETGAKRSEWQRRMALWQEAYDEAEHD